MGKNVVDYAASIFINTRVEEKLSKENEETARERLKSAALSYLIYKAIRENIQPSPEMISRGYSLVVVFSFNHKSLLRLLTL